MESSHMTEPFVAVESATTTLDESVKQSARHVDQNCSDTSLRQHPTLQRHYSTIGIGNVFVDMNPKNNFIVQPRNSLKNHHQQLDMWLFPSDYLSNNNGAIISQLFPPSNHGDHHSPSTTVVASTYMGNELIGQIKSQPEDFVVHEIAMVQGQLQKADINMGNTTNTLLDMNSKDVVAIDTVRSVGNASEDRYNEIVTQKTPDDLNVLQSSSQLSLSPSRPAKESIHCDVAPATEGVTSLPSNDLKHNKHVPISTSTNRHDIKQRVESSCRTDMKQNNEKEKVDDPLQCLELLLQNHLHSFTEQKVNIDDAVCRNHETIDTIQNDNDTSSSLHSTKQLRRMLQDMEEKALQRIQMIHNVTKYDMDKETLPLPTASSHSSHFNNDVFLEVTLSYPKSNNHNAESTEQQYKQHKTNLHEWFRRVYHLLVAESCKNRNHHDDIHVSATDTDLNDTTNNRRDDDCYYYYTIRIRIDTTFDGLIPYLYEPIEDLPLLYRYAKNGYDTTKAYNKRNFGRNLGNKRLNDPNVLLFPVLRLLPNLPRPYRRPIHQLIDQKSNSLLGTETLTDYPLLKVNMNEDNQVPITGEATATTTTAIRISWTKMAARKASKKRQREEVSDLGGGALQQNRSTEQPKQGMSKMLCVVKKRQREHLGMINTISAVLKCSSSDIGFAGMKDLQAITYQFGTLNGNVVQRYQQNQSLKDILCQRGIEIIPLHPVPEPLNKGDLIGNYFEIVVRDVRRVQLEYNNRASASIESTIQEAFVPVDDVYLQSMIDRVRKNGFINFYGEQRVGDPGHTSLVGVRAFDIGRAMLQQNYMEAIDLLITGRRMINGIDLVEKNDVEPFRRVWKETNGDAIATSKALPSGGNSVPRERAVLKGLVRYGTDQPLSAFRCLARNERLFFINAYQSYVWNMMTTERIQLYGNHIVVGDLVLVEKSSNKPIIATSTDLLDESKKEVFHMTNVVLPMPGYDTIYPNNRIGILYQEFLRKENVQFDKNALHDEAKARGSYRRVIAQVDQLVYERLPSDLPLVDIQLKFNLPKGSYATMLLRELMLKTVARDNPNIYCAAPEEDD